MLTYNTEIYNLINVYVNQTTMIMDKIVKNVVINVKNVKTTVTIVLEENVQILLGKIILNVPVFKV